ncbi:MAG TPA: DnaB-like helicase C-terminal domain-containing protein, partial [Alphaproteobacteria bacterium]|nr:DnaB-like helicase C-terminal domain-containing protein [Alphaproteobacteria bacterium]
DKRPGLSDLRDSGCIEQDSDMVMFIYRDEYYAKKKDMRIKTKNTEAYDMADEQAKKGKAELIVAKNRQNVLGTVDLNFSGERQEFYE